MADVSEELIAEALEAFEAIEVERIVGGSQKAVVRIQRDTSILVLKVIALGVSSPDALRRAEREVELLGSLDSPYVVAVASEMVELGDPICGVAWLEENLSGNDLSASLGPQWAWPAAAQMARQVALGLGAAHTRGVVHRDLSANNVRRLDDGTYKVMDFGFARHTLRSGLTVAGQPGTPGYASPEHLHAYSGTPNAASDVFCVGNLIFIALAGVLPIPYEGDDADYVARLLAVDIPDLAALRPDLTGAQLTLVRRCLHPQPARRYLNGTILAGALEELD